MNVSGELDSAIFDLAEDDAQPLTPLIYDLQVKRFGSELFLQGKIEAKFEFTCVRTLEKFAKTIQLGDFASSLEIGSNEQIDVANALREDILLAFPAYPRCDEADQPMPCEIDSRYLAVDKPMEDVVGTPPRPESTDTWEALDALKSTDKQGDINPN